MDKGNSHSGCPQGYFFDDIKNFMSNLVSDRNSSSIHNAVNLPLSLNEKISNSHMNATFMAFADAIIPGTLGALDLRIDEYVQWTLERYASIQAEWGNKTVSLTYQTAQILDIAAVYPVVSQKVKHPLNFTVYPDGGLFTALSHDDRFEAIRTLENLQIDLEVLPPPFRNNSGLVKNIVTALHQTVLFGYYSEWFSLGPTRLAYPEDQQFERQRFIWDRLDYPGPSFGYRDVRGYLVDEFSE